MPSALETLVKILKLEQETGYQNSAVIGGLESFVENWVAEAHQQARRPEHHALVDELAGVLREYGQLTTPQDRTQAVHHMLGRITGRISPASGSDAPPMPLPPLERAELPVGDLPPAEIPYRDQGEELEEADTPTGLEDAQEEDLEPIDTSDGPFLSFVAEPQPRPFESPRRRFNRLSVDEANRRYERLLAPVTTVPRVGEKMAARLEKLDIRTVADLLFHFPRRYEDYSRLKTISRLVPGETVTVIAAVRAVHKRQARAGRPYLQVVVGDGTGALNIAFFGQLWLQRQFRPGSQLVFRGTVEQFRGELVMTNPEWEVHERLHTGQIMPVYGLTKGLSARTMRHLTRQVVDTWASQVPEHLPLSVLDRANLADLHWALQQIHFPESFEALDYARRRLIFDELLLFQLQMQAQRRDWQSVPGQPLHVSDEWLDAALNALPYVLTAAQRRVLSEIRADIAREVPMNRLLQGDVGSGKTVIAALALAVAVLNGKQAALMAPTSLLAEQHARSVTALLHRLPAGSEFQVRLLTGNTSATEREAILAGLADGSVHVIIGTHAILQEDVTFQNLALAVIDEQHRFGVEQRGSLRSKGTHPHVLVMTATPIPRTLALTMYADLDLSIIDELPPGRLPVQTRALFPVERERAYSFVERQIEQGHQAFIVYPLVEASESLQDTGAAVDRYEHLSQHVFARRRVGLLHGRMSASEKEATMAAFAAGDIDILVSTSVVEVGIDVPNATVILVEDADRFGLAQLHQFRGRVGRSEHESYCLLISSSTSPEARQRLAAMEETTDGFRLAEIDWEMRGPGDLLGVRQSGIGQFRLAQGANPQLVELAQREARTLLSEDPALELEEHQLLHHRMAARLYGHADIS